MAKKKRQQTNFWQSLPRPLFVLAPMANVTDAAFRSIIAKYGKPDVVWTEFVSADGLMSSGREKLLIDLQFSKKERPIVAQLFTGHPEVMKGAATLVRELGFDGLDINMGCPDRAVEKQGGGASLIKNPKNALAVIRAAEEGVENNIPVTVKTRIGYNKIDWEWLETLLKLRLPALTVHLRTRKEMSDVPAHWELMPEIMKLRDTVQADIPVKERTLILGNGDVKTVKEAQQKIKEFGCDGVMIGRGIFGTPWLFAGGVEGKVSQTTKESDGKSVTLEYGAGGILPTPADRLQILVEHTNLFEKKFLSARAGKNLKNFATMKKHFKAYVSGWEGAKELRAKLMETNSSQEVKKIIKDYLSRQS